MKKKKERYATKKHFLLTNDDGIGAPGLMALAQAVRPYGDVTILAPNRDWSGAGRYRTFKDPLRLHETQLPDGTPALTTNGSPADCAALALMGAVARPIDLILSGINSSANLSHDVTCSGTVGAVLEGMTWDIPGIAFSLDIGRSKRPGANRLFPSACLAFPFSPRERPLSSPQRSPASVGGLCFLWHDPVTYVNMTQP